MTRSNKTVRAALMSGLMTLLLAVPVVGQDPSAQPDRTNDTPAVTQDQQQDESSPNQGQSQTDTSGDQSTTTTAGQQGSTNTQMTESAGNFTAGEKYKIEGNVVSRDADTVTILTDGNQRVIVGINDQTEVKEQKINPFRGAKKYGMTSLLPGLEVEIEGRGDGAGRLMAEKIKFTQDELRMAMAIETRVTPVERNLAETQQNAERLSGQINELNSVSNAARGGAVAAQETADKAMGAAGQAQSAADQANAGVRAANERIVSLDNYDIKHSAVVNFRVNSYRLSDEAKQELDQIAQQAANERGYMIEVVGFASADGSANYNRRLSENRADSVVRYLAEEHNVPLRRIVTPFGFGELQPVADNSTRAGREQNRRVEVRVLVNRGLQNVAGMQTGTGAPESGAQGSGQQDTQQNNNLQNDQTQGQFGQTTSDSGNTGTTGNAGSTHKTEEQD